jgi:hypothetical protein
MLTLPIKKKWFDMIAAKEKLEEYREIKPYYDARFQRLGEQFCIRFRAGYLRDAPLMQCLVVVHKSFGRPEWGAVPRVKYYVISIVNIKTINTSGEAKQK